MRKIEEKFKQKLQLTFTYTTQEPFVTLTTFSKVLGDSTQLTHALQIHDKIRDNTKSKSLILAKTVFSKLVVTDVEFHLNY